MRSCTTQIGRRGALATSFRTAHRRVGSESNSTGQSPHIGIIRVAGVRAIRNVLPRHDVSSDTGHTRDFRCLGTRQFGRLNRSGMLLCSIQICRVLLRQRQSYIEQKIFWQHHDDSRVVRRIVPRLLLLWSGIRKPGESNTECYYILTAKST